MNKLMRGLVIVTAVALAFISKTSSADNPPQYILQWGSYGTGNGQFNQPGSIAIDNAGNVYVTDGQNNRIQKFTSSGAYLTQWGSFGNQNGQLYLPYGIAIDRDGNVLVSDDNNHRIQKFTSNGTYLAQWGSNGTGDGQFTTPASIALDTSGNVYVADQNNNRIQKFTGTGVYLTQWGSFGSEPGQFEAPTGIALDASGNVYVTDLYNDRIQKFTSSGVYLTQWGSHGTGNGQFMTIEDIKIDREGNVYVSDAGNSRIQKFTSSGTYLTQWGSHGTGNGQFSDVGGIATDRNGNVYVTDISSNRIQKFGSGPGLKPVVLAHGICSDTTMWSDLKSYLSGHGFTVAAVDLDPNNPLHNSRPINESAVLASFLDTNFPNQNVDVVGYSMGGLASRYYIRQRKQDSRISNLITLGTPHHGSDIASQTINRRWLTVWLKKYLCELNTDAITDLATGSNFINLTNYGSTSIGDQFLKSSKGPHVAEKAYDPNIKYWTIAGTQPSTGPFFDVTFTAWSTTNANRLLGIMDYANDGVVGVDAARMYNGQSMNYRDVDLGLSPIQHTTFSLVYGGTRSYQNATDLFPIIENILRGGTPPSPQPAQLFTAERVQSESDTVVTVLLSENGTLSAGQVMERPFNLPTTSLAQVTFAADSASFRLRKPNGTLLTPADTSTTPGLTYTEEPSLGLAAYRIENPTPGAWHAVFDASGVALDQDYALGAEATSTVQAVVTPAQGLVYAPGTVGIRASLQNTGTPQTGVSWSTTVTRPDSTTFSVNLYDDGAHQDSLAGDGIFGATLSLSGQAGVYRIDAQVLRSADSVSFTGSSLVEATHFQDLAMDSTLSFSQNSANAGDSLIISGTVRNLGTTAVGNVMVELWDNHQKLDSQTLSLNGGQSSGVAFLWHAAPPDTHLVELVVNPFVVLDEANIDNNTASKQIVLGHPITGVGGPGGGSQAQLMLAPPRPNPSNGQTILAFSLARESEASLAIYDILGRRIKQWHWTKLVAGPHQVTWDGQADDGHRIAPGILFYRLSVNGQNLKQKLIHLQ